MLFHFCSHNHVNDRLSQQFELLPRIVNICFVRDYCKPTINSGVYSKHDLKVFQMKNILFPKIKSGIMEVPTFPTVV